jgi:signal peptidase I
MNSASAFYLVIFALIFIGIKVGQWKMYQKAGQPGWAALVPVYSSIIWLKLIGKPLWWVALLFIPVVNVLVLVAMTIELAKAYGKYKLAQHAAALLLPFYFFPRIGFDPATKYLGAPETHKKVPPKSGLREWGDAILFAGVAALIIRTFFIEAFMIPTSSMERTLMAGDFLFVSKFHYGARMPMVPLSVPFVHNKIKVGDFVAPSYLSFVQLPFFRLPGLENVERNDIVVFNYPAHDIHDLGDGAGKVEPVSMKENYIKRCVAVPGDTLQIIDQQVYIDGKPGKNPPFMQYQYQVETNSRGGFSPRRLNELGFRSPGSPNANWGQASANVYYFWMPDSIAQIMDGWDGVTDIDTIYRAKGEFQRGVYPSFQNEKGQLFSHNIDNFGPIVIPARGMTVELTPENLALYARCIDPYEGHELEVKDGKAFIDGQEASSYTFEMDYYFVMGNNRHNSEDGRFWGFVPANHIVGKPLFVFFSYESDFGIRWNRIGTQYVQ